MAYDIYTASNGETIINYGYIATVWNKLINKGIPDTGVAALMGNFYAESYVVPYLTQGDSEPFQVSIDYTNNVNNGTISEYDFVHNGPRGGGYGLAQWTYKPRKQGLYNKWQNDGYASIGDVTLACEYVWDELNGSYKSVLDYIKNNSKTLNQKTVKVLKDYENPENQSSDVQSYRFRLAYAIMEYMTTSPTDPPDDGSGDHGGNGGGNEPTPESGKSRFPFILRRPHLYIRR